jgi:hypothetical protein
MKVSGMHGQHAALNGDIFHCNFIGIWRSQEKNYISNIVRLVYLSSRYSFLTGFGLFRIMGPRLREHAGLCNTWTYRIDIDIILSRFHSQYFGEEQKAGFARAGYNRNSAGNSHFRCPPQSWEPGGLIAFTN